MSLFTWTAVTSPALFPQTVVWDTVGNNWIVGAGANPVSGAYLDPYQILVSPNGSEWTGSTPFPFPGSSRAIVNGLAHSSAHGRTVALVSRSSGADSNNPDLIYTTDDGGTTWTGRGNPIAGENQSGTGKVRWDATAGIFIGWFQYTFNLHPSIWTSPDGITWTGRASPWDTKAPFLGDFAYSPTLGMWIATGIASSPTSTVMWSTNNGVSWTQETGGPMEALNTGVTGACWDPTCAAFFAVPAGSSHKPYKSTDGTTWVQQAAATASAGQGSATSVSGGVLIGNSQLSGGGTPPQSTANCGTSFVNETLANGTTVNGYREGAVHGSVVMIVGMQTGPSIWMTVNPPGYSGATVVFNNQFRVQTLTGPSLSNLWDL